MTSRPPGSDLHPRRSGKAHLSVLRALGLTSVVVAAASCNALDTTRVPQRAATLGTNIYSVFCDRLGASSIPEDLTGASYDAICHFDDQGEFGFEVDQSVLPAPATAEQNAARKLSVAKLERMAQRRKDLVRAFDAIFPDVEIPDVTSAAPGAKVRLHDALFRLTQTLNPLYEITPAGSASADPLLPANTRALARVVTSLGAPGLCPGGVDCTWDADCDEGDSCQSDVRAALSHLWGRRGYRPSTAALGVLRPLVAYPDLRALTKSTLAVVGPKGSASRELEQVLTVLQQEMLTAGATVSPLPTLVVDADLAEPSRPRQDIEFMQALFLTQDDAFASSAGPFFIARRDRRGIVVPAGNTPGVKYTVAPPFADADGDGYADVDSFGRLVGADGRPLALDPPFAIPGETVGGVNPYGQPDSSIAQYTYLDTSRALVNGLVQHLIPLLDPTVLASGDPDGWQQEHETLMYAIAGAYTLLGDRTEATYDYAKEGKGGQKVSYRGFKGDTSPLPELVHALGQVLADPDSDALILALLDLLENHEQVVARLMGAALRIREISLEHDELAAQGKEPKAELPYEVPLWDQMALVVEDILAHPGMLKGLLEGLADDTVVTPCEELQSVPPWVAPNAFPLDCGGVQHMGETVSKFMTFRDELTYNRSGSHYDGTGVPHGINGPAVNLTVSPTGGAFDNPKTPVDRAQPLRGKNRSAMQRSLQLIYDTTGGPSCNKNDAVVRAILGGYTVTWPLLGPKYKPCEFFQIDNLTYFYLDSMLPIDHPKRSTINVKSETVQDIMTVLGVFGQTPDDLFVESSDIAGLTLRPEPWALNRLVFFGAHSDLYPAMPDHDALHDVDPSGTTPNAGTTNDFVYHLMEPSASAWCPPDTSVPQHPPVCEEKQDTVRGRDANTIFLWERFGFTSYLLPLVKVFAETDCTNDKLDKKMCGERIFADIIQLLNTHWPGPDHGDECAKGSPTIPCSEAGLNRYEPILAEAFLTDIVPALHELAKTSAMSSKITVKRGPHKGEEWTGAEVMEKLAKVFFSQDYASSAGMVDRAGSSTTTWVDGTHPQQVTPFTLFADALHKMDLRFAEACDCSKLTGQLQAECTQDHDGCLVDAAARRGQWRRARSQLVDELLAVDGEGTNATFRDPALAPTLIAALELVREQLNANCPEREQGTPCTWAKRDLGDKLSGVISRPLFAALIDLGDKIREDDAARRGLEALLVYVLKSSNDGGQSLQGALASLTDGLQVLADDANLAPLLVASASGAAPGADPAGPGALHMLIELLNTVTDDEYDPYHLLDQVLPNVVTPMDDGAGLSPLEVLLDVIADVNRIDASSVDPMSQDDYQGVMATARSFMLDETRGLEQLYTIIQERPKP